jgi:hypothetical protein
VLEGIEPVHIADQDLKRRQHRCQAQRH